MTKYEQQFRQYLNNTFGRAYHFPLGQEEGEEQEYAAFLQQYHPDQYAFFLAEYQAEKETQEKEETTHD